MARLVAGLLAPALLLGAWLTAVPASAQTKSPPRLVQDDAKMFSPKARDRANADIAKIKSAFHKDLAIETVLEAPTPANGNKEAWNKFYNEWALGRFKSQQINGIYVVLAKEPHVLRVVLGDETRRQNLFTNSDREKLEEIMLTELKAKNADAALTKATDFVHSTMLQHKQSRSETQPPPAENNMNWVTYLIIGVAIFLGLWLIIGLFRGLSGAGGGGAPGMAGGGGGGGGGFFSSLLGGMFGAAAGMWMYNNFFGGHSSTAYGAGPSSTDYSGGNAAEPTDVGGGGSVGGGDYGGDAGGGDAGGAGGDWGGGGDAGGGGGGDWGGGGGDWGGGGGDFGGGGGGDW